MKISDHISHLILHCYIKVGLCYYCEICSIISLVTASLIDLRLKISKNVNCAKRQISSFTYILTCTLPLQYKHSLTSSSSLSTLFTVLISPHTHSQNIHCQYLNHSHLNFKAKYCSDNTNSHFLPLAVTTVTYTSTPTRTYPVHVTVFDKHYLFL